MVEPIAPEPRPTDVGQPTRNDGSGWPADERRMLQGLGARTKAPSVIPIKGKGRP